ncbi:putative multidrug resistance-associated protein [Trypanosoma cruzi]|uniref:Putative multidrug resistance-associated protein n=1 Tax=Trypanosoma cruzi TaxID=5693 RepID=A0A2V2V6W4_TRYCR|nr:putative multidrug resistance-associated protein [Trypanosoma cruzi]
MTWEPRFIANIEAKRDIELQYLKGVQVCRVLTSFINDATPPVMIAVVLLLYHILGHELTPEIVFPAISLLAIIRMPFMMIPTVVTSAVQFLVSMARISAFLDCESSPRSVMDIRSYNTAHRASAGSWCELAAVFENTDITALVPVKLPRLTRVSLSLTARLMRRFCCCDACRPEKKGQSPAQFHEPQQPPPNSPATPTTTGSNNINEKKRRTKDVLAEDRFELLPKNILRAVSIEIPKGKLTVIIGPTGSGKTTLLAALLGEYEVTHGRVWATRSIAYVPQQPWIMNATLRENVLFFAPEDPKRLQETVRACQLESDLKLLAGGCRRRLVRRAST